MDKSGPIIIVDDDTDDLEIFNQALSELKIKNKILLFTDAEGFLRHMRTSQENVFFILCDINMPVIDGFQLRDQIYIDQALSAISVPFIFFSTSGDINHITKAYKKPIQGYFRKPSGYDDIKAMFTNIILYWTSSYHPVKRAPEV